jgi:anthranilate phosphoribosyltransferase
MNLHEALTAVLDGHVLTREESREVFVGALHEETDPVLFGGFLAALAQRREDVAEIAGTAEALRSVMVTLPHDKPHAIDTAGTGGDGLGTFNLSTAAALVAAAAGATVIKHGNRSVSSRCGSADLLEAAGVEVALPAEAAAQVLEQEGITFLFAPVYHPAMRYAVPVRRSLGVRTIFNYLGPLCNPGRVRRQLLGVSDPARVSDFASVLEGLGHERALVVHTGGADELTLAGEAKVVAVGDVSAEGFDPIALGLQPAPVDALRGGDAARNLRLLEGVLAGEAGPLRDAVLLNAAAALTVAGVASDPSDGIFRATEAIDSGAAAAKLRSWIQASRRAAGVAAA